MKKATLFNITLGMFVISGILLIYSFFESFYYFVKGEFLCSTFLAITPIVISISLILLKITTYNANKN